MGVNVPSSYDHDVDVTSIPPISVSSVGAVGPVTVNGIPDAFDIDITHLPKIELNIDPIEIKPLDLSIRLKEIPSIRSHLPANFCVGFSLLGVEIAKIRLCGEAQVITEPYQPNPCEICGKPALSHSTDTTHTIDTIINLKEG
jgi:hypothetical protein